MIKGLLVVGEHEVETPAASGRRYDDVRPGAQNFLDLVSNTNTRVGAHADVGVDICLRRDFNEGAALSSHLGTTFAALGRDSRASALAGRSSVDRLVFVAA